MEWIIYSVWSAVMILGLGYLVCQAHKYPIREPEEDNDN